MKKCNVTNCQFPEEMDFFSFTGTHCRFHLPLQDNPGNPSEKASWVKGSPEWLAFESVIFSRLLSAVAIGDAVSSRADYRNVVFPHGFDFSGFNQPLHADFSATIFGDFVNFANAIFTEATKFSGNFGKAANFSNAKFGKLANFENVIFKESANFTEATFGECSTFSKAIFRDGLNFSGAVFGNKANFIGTNFGNGANFADVKIGHSCVFGNTTFGNSTNLSCAIFGDDVVLQNSKFGELVKFEGVNFGERVNFTGSSFGKSVNFTSATFGASADFSLAKFQDFANFTKTTFGVSTKFSGAEFGDIANFSNSKFGLSANFEEVNFLNRVLFVDTSFQGDVSFSTGEENKRKLLLRRINFSKAKFFGPCTFENRVFTSETLFNGAEFHDCANFHGCTFHQGMTFRSEQFLRTKAESDTETAKLEGCYRTLRLGMENLRARNEEAMFFGKEMECQRHRLFFSFDWFVSALYNILSGYGRSIIRPLACLLSLTVLSFVFYALAFYGGAGSLPYGPFNYVWEIIEFTAEQIFRPFGIWSVPAGEKITYEAVRVFLKEYHRPMVPLLASVQSLATIGLLTLFLLALRRRFKMD